MVLKILLFLLPGIALAQISIRIGNDIYGNLKVEYEGQDSRIIPEEERAAWNLEDSQLKDAVAALTGSRPDSSYLKSPTPWGDLYKTYNWPQVRRTLVVLLARVQSVNMEPGIVIEEEFVNNSTANTIYSLRFEQKIQETISNTWSTHHKLQLGQSIKYSMNAVVAGMNGSTSMSFSSDWGKENTISKSVTVEYAGGGKFNVGPGQKVKSALYIERGSMDIQVFYEARLQGSVANNYARTFKGHHFLSYSINDVLEAARLPTYITAVENVRVGFYMNANFEVTDPARKTLRFAPLSIKSLN